MTTEFQPPRLHDPATYHFGSDNYAGAHPEVLEYLATVNGGHVPGYGEDVYSERLQVVMRDLFGEDAVAHPVMNGTGANVVSLDAMLPPWGAVVSASSAHFNTDESTAPQRVAGIKSITIDTADGKLTPHAIAQFRADPQDVHFAQPLVLSISNSTELGSVYTPDEVAALTAAAKANGMTVHIDGSRLSNAAAATGATFAELTQGADVISLGATKNGAIAAEAVIVRNPAAVPGVQYLTKINLQLASKQRFMAAQLLALFEGDLWLRNATHANAQAAKLAARISELPGCTVPVNVDANAVFVMLPEGVADRVRERGMRFYDWPPIPGSVRLMTAWDTPDEAIDELINELSAAIQDS